MVDAQKRITKAIGKINSALVSVERGRELQIRTDTAENRLQRVLSLLERIKRESRLSLGMQGGMSVRSLFPSIPVPYAPGTFVMPEKEQKKLMGRLYVRQQLHRQKLAHAEEVFAADQRRKTKSARAPQRRNGVPTKPVSGNGNVRMPPAKRRSYAGRQNRQAGKPKRNSARRSRRQENRNSVMRYRPYG